MKTDDLLATNREEIRKTWKKSQEDVLKDIHIIKEWLLTQKHLPEMPNDNMIEHFLFNCKFSIEKTKQNLDMYYSVRDLLPEIFRNLNLCSPQMEAVFDVCYYIPMPKLTQNLHRINVFGFKKVNADLVDMQKVCAYLMNNVFEIRVQEDLTMGDICFVDYSNVSFKLLTKISPLILKQCALLSEKVFTHRIYGIHFYNAPAYIDNFVSLFKSLFSKKLSERIFLHQTLEEVARYLPLDLLPKDYGGKEKSLDELTDLWKSKLFEYKNRFDQLDEMKVNEQLRPVKLKNDEILGYYGNFKKLDTD